MANKLRGLPAVEGCGTWPAADLERYRKNAEKALDACDALSAAIVALWGDDAMARVEAIDDMAEDVRSEWPA